MWRPVIYRRSFFVALICACLSGCAAISGLTLEVDPAEGRLVRCLDRDDWRLERSWNASDAKTMFRWRFGEQPDRVVSADRSSSQWESLQTILDEISLDSTTRASELLQKLSKRSGRIGRNATIALARLKPAAADPDKLRDIVTVTSLADVQSLLDLKLGSKNGAQNEEHSVPVSTRAAAAEAWCHVLAGRGEKPVEERLFEAGKLWQDKTLPASVRGELLRGLAAHVPPERIVGYGSMFPASNAEVAVDLQRAAIDGCLIHLANHPQQSFNADCWPATIENAAFNSDPEIRCGYAHWLARSRHPRATECLAPFLRDSESRVWKAAIDALADVKTDDALETLHRVTTRPSELHRAAAVSALAAWGPAEIKSFLKDESPHVRRATTLALSNWPGPDAAILLDQALADADLETQHSAIVASQEWDDEFAMPVLLAGLQNSAVRTRRECLDELRRRTDFNGAFPVTAEVSERTAALAELAKVHDWPIDAMTRFRLASSPPVEATPVSSDVATVIAEMLRSSTSTERRRELCESLRMFGPDVVPAIETVCLRENGTGVDSLMLEVLPVLDPVHAHLQKLRSDDVAVRRRAAGDLVEHGRTATLSRLVLRQLHEILTKEQDGLVWRQCLAAVAPDATSEAEQIALLALNNTWPDVRRLGCDYVGQHRRPHQALWLLPLLTDSSDAVRLAAIEAIGRCRNLSVIEERPGGGAMSGLRAAAVDPSRTIRLAALISLARLGDDAGSVALLRWAEFEPSSERIKAIRAIAQTGRRQYEADLARLAWTETDGVIRRELLSALEQIVPVNQRPVGADALRAEDRIAAWAARWEAARTSSTMSAP